ncbi:hypothetical protein N752_16685 [Desulforamulus aquiferis]|nr:hypothetical protein N752_16685 [Desulforamulus aquiferis]
MQISEQLIREIVGQVLSGMEQPTPAKKMAVATGRTMTLLEKGNATTGTKSDEVVIALAPAFGKHQNKTIVNIPHSDVLREVIAGIEEEGIRPRVIRVLGTSDVGFLAYEGAKICGSGVAVGLQSRGTT